MPTNGQYIELAAPKTISTLSQGSNSINLPSRVGDYVAQNFLAADPQLPEIQAGLANDTAPSGITDVDHITSDPTIAGTVTEVGQVALLRVGFDEVPVGDFVDVTSTLGADGSFTLSRNRLEEIYGGALPDGTHTLHLQAADATGTVLSATDVRFQLDTTTPVLTVDAPLRDGEHSSTARLIGSVVDTGAGVSDVRYVLVDNGDLASLTVDAQGQFDQALQTMPLALGSHEVTLAVFDQAGNLAQESVDFRVSPDFVLGPTQTLGWGAFTADTLILDERDSYLVQTSLPVVLGQTAGSRKLQFDLGAEFDTTDQSAATEDQFLMYLVDPTNPTQTLLDQGEPGTALFALAGDQAEYRPGTVRFDGSRVEVDLTSLAAETEGLLVFQLINGDEDTGSRIRLENLVNQVDPEGVVSPIFPVQPNTVPVGPGLNLGDLNPAQDVELLVNNVRLDSDSGQYTAELQVKNTGSSVIGRQVAVVFPDLPEGVELVDPSGTDSTGSPYVNLRNAIQPGGLDAGAISDAVQIVFNNPELVRVALTPTVLVGPLNRAPGFEPIEALSVMPGDRLEVPLVATDSDGDRITFSLESDGPLPTGGLEANGTLVFSPTPEQLGTYEFTLVASDGAVETTQAITLDVVADPVTTTRVSGLIQNTDQQPLGGIPIELGDLGTVTGADGSFQLEVAGALPDDTLKIHAEELGGSLVYPYIAEKLPLLLEHDPFTGVNNVIARPIYLPPIDIANAKTIDPAQDVVVTTDAIPSAAVTVAAGTLEDQQGNPYTGQLSITEVPPDLTPAALPENLHPDLVVTIQPGEMVFTTPAPLSLPNSAGYEAGAMMDLWSINPTTGLFDNVGTGQVSADGRVIETIEGGIRNSSWHFFTPPPPVLEPPNQDPRNPDERCDECQARGNFTSEVELHSGAVLETHELVPYQSLGSNRGLTLSYDSLRADPRPILHFGYNNIQANPNQQLVGELTVNRGEFEYQVPGFVGEQFGLEGGEHFWSIADNGGSIDAALQADLRSQPSGQYNYELTTGIRQFNGEIFAGSSSTSTGQFLHVNTIDSFFGSGWGLAGVQELVENQDGSVLLIDGDGSELLFEAPAAPGDAYVAPPGDFSTLERLADGTFRRTLEDQTTYSFNAQNKLVSVLDRNDNKTQHIYDEAGRLTQIIDPVGLATTFAYTGDKVSAIIDPTGRITQMEYNTAGNLIRITDPDRSQRTWDYDTDHHMVAETDKRGKREETFYDFAGRATRAIRKDGSVVQVAPVQVQGLYRPEATIDPFSAPAATPLGTVEANYADGSGNVVASTLDQAGQVVTSRDGASFLPAVERNEENLVTDVIDGRGNIISYTYDAQGNVTSIADELSGGGQPQPATSLFPNPLYRTGDRPQSTALGDLDQDGDLDLLTANYNTVSVLLGNGDGSFKFEANLEAGASLRSVALEDLNSDGNLDIITVATREAARLSSFADNPEEAMSVRLGNGNGSFAPRVDYAIGDGNGFLAVGDLDGNSTLDLVTTNYDNSISVLLGNGDGSFAPRIDHTTENGFGSGPLVLGDLDSDGNLDLVTTNFSNSVSVMLGTGDGSFAASSNYALKLRPESLALEDLDRDGNLDIVTAGYNQLDGGSEVAVLLGIGDGSFAAEVDYSVGNGPASLILSDLDSNGDLDLITGNNSENSVSVLLGNGDGSFAPRTDYTAGNGLTSLSLGDLDGNGTFDLVAANSLENRVSVLLGNGDGSLTSSSDTPTTDYAVGIRPRSVAVPDLDGNSVPDLVTANYYSNSISILLGNGNGSFLPQVDYDTGYAPASVASGDLDSDGALDLVTANYLSNNISVLLGSEDGSFAPQTSYTTGDSPSFVALGDVDGDGDLDVVTTNYDNSVSVLLGNNDGSFAAPTNYVVGVGLPESYASVALGDLDRDGSLDLVTANSSNNSVSVLLGNGDGSFGPRTSYSAGSEPTFVALGDLDRDSDLDIVTTNYDSTVSVLLGNGDGSFAPPTDYIAGYEPTSVVIGDLDRDGNLDLLTANPEDNSVSLLLGNGDGFFEDPRNFLVGFGPQSVALGDLDLDGDLDWATANADDSSVSPRFNSTIQTGVDGELGDRRFTYDPVFNQLTSETDELGRQTLYEIDPTNGNTLSMTQVVGEVGGTNDVVTQFTYTSQGLVDIITDPLGRVTDNDYDALGRLVSTTFALGTTDEAVQRYEYDAAGSVIALIDENTNRTTFGYDNLNRMTGVTEVDPDGAGALTSPVTTYAYDAAGNLIETTDAQGNVTQSEYDELDRLRKSIDANDGETLISYDPAGNPLSVVDPLGHQTQNRYDARNRLVETIDPEGGSTQFRYDFDNNRTGVIDPLGNRTKFVYDARSRMIREIDPLGNTTIYNYNPVDNLVAQIDRNERRTEFEYDELDRLTQETWVGTDQVIDYSYDKTSNLTSVTDNFSSLAYTYDNLNRVKTVDNTGTPDVPPVVLSYTYDGVGNVLSMADTINGQPGGINAYTYDALNRMSQVAQSGNGVTDKRVNFGYNELGQFSSINRYADLNGTQLVAGSTYSYDALNRLTNLTHRNSTTEVAFYDLAYDPASRITQIADVEGENNYTYDDRDQLVGAEHADAANSDETYSYDANGNRISSSLHENGYITGPNNRLLSDGTYNYDYDNEGTLIRQTEIATGTVTELAWDYRNRLVGVTDRDVAGNVTQQVEYTYDALDHRISKTVDPDGAGVATSAATHFVYDGQDVLLDFVDTDGEAGPNSPVLAQRYLHGPAVDQVLAQEDTAGNVAWHLTDHLGTVRDLANNNGAVLNHFTYDSFGNVISKTNSTVDTRYLFTGREWDEETGQYYYRARYYNPYTGMFTSEDPIGFDGGDANLYRYVGNSPVNGTDPSGNINLFIPLKIVLDILLNPKPAEAPTLDHPNLQRQEPDIPPSGPFCSVDPPLDPFNPFIPGVGPEATNPRLQRTVDQLYKPTDKVPGGTAGIIRSELRSGETKHIIKGQERINQLKKILKQEELSAADRATAITLMQDLQNALEGR